MLPVDRTTPSIHLMPATQSPERQATGPAEPAASGARTWTGRLSLRVKGILSLLVVVVYVGLMTTMVTQERLKLPSIVKDLERVHKAEEQMIQVTTQTARAGVATSEAYFIEQGDLRTRQLFVELTALDSILGAAKHQHVELGAFQERLGSLARDVAHKPSRESLADLRAVLDQLAKKLNELGNGLRNEKQRLLTSYQLVHDRITLETMFFLFLGVVVVGAVMTIFFTRLTWDIRRAGMRAMAIVKGYRGKPLVVTRGDEVGGLMQAINQMQSELRERERQLELSRQQQFHHEKMAAVGSLAAAVAHEINNPIMAISGLAEVLQSDETERSADSTAREPGIPGMILEQAKRISTITRHISEFATPQSPEPQLIDLNAILRNTANFVRFDQRYRRIDLAVREDTQIDPVFAVGDHVMQVLINLLINAADAVESLADRKPKVLVSTSQNDSQVIVMVEDNGVGMSAEVMAHACEEFFTTKPRGKGSGLGLFLSRNLLEQNGATLALESVEGRETRVTICFPRPLNTEID